MERKFTLEYWIDDDWYVGRIKEVPGVFSQGETLEDLEGTVADAYSRMVISEESGYTLSGDRPGWVLSEAKRQAPRPLCESRQR